MLPSNGGRYASGTAIPRRSSSRLGPELRASLPADVGQTWRYHRRKPPPVHETSADEAFRFGATAVATSTWLKVLDFGWGANRNAGTAVRQTELQLAGGRIPVDEVR